MMKRYYYDFHLHSCLSPCGGEDSTPNNIAGMARLCGLDIIALTDHNTVKNCPAFFEACERYGLIPVAGAELTTSEDIHAVCLFETLEAATEFDRDLQKHRALIRNKTEIFGNQFILDGGDNIIGEEPYLLSNATDISIEDAPRYVEGFSGICYPAHIDRQANGIISVLGTFPETPYFKCVEFNAPEKAEEYISKYSLEDKTVIVGSDAHYLTDMRDAESFFELDTDNDGAQAVRKALFKKLRNI